jgi:hypothetical protein
MCLAKIAARKSRPPMARDPPQECKIHAHKRGAFICPLAQRADRLHALNLNSIAHRVVDRASAKRARTPPSTQSVSHSDKTTDGAQTLRRISCIPPCIPESKAGRTAEARHKTCDLFRNPRDIRHGEQVACLLMISRPQKASHTHHHPSPEWAAIPLAKRCGSCEMV